MLLNANIFESMVESNPRLDITKIEYYGTKFSVAQTIDNVLKVGGFIVKNGYKGKSIGVMLPNIPEAIFALYACSATGSVCNLINPRLPTLHLKRILLSTKK